MTTPTVALLPHYLELYDQKEAYAWPRMQEFLNRVDQRLKELGLGVVELPVCRRADQFSKAMMQAQEEGALAIISLHLAYSPSLESAPALAASPLPLIVLDTTTAYDFGPRQSSAEIMYNHGIHGVQDLCNLLNRLGKPFFIAAGHLDHSDVLERVASYVRGAVVAKALMRSRVGRVGKPFLGMGDFQVDDRELWRDLGIEMVDFDFIRGKIRLEAVQEIDLDQEAQLLGKRWDLSSVPRETLRSSLRTSLALRTWIREEALDAFTVNFLALDNQEALPSMPFLEACLAQERGLGYAGEGDGLTAAFVGAWAQVFERTTFTEMFCPDWAGGTVFLSHMGEANAALLEEVRLAEQEFPYIDAFSPVAVYGRFMAGQVTLINLSPQGKGTYRLLAVLGDILDPQDARDNLMDTIHGWFKPPMALESFLENYSRLGGTHHSVLVYGDRRREVQTLGALMGWEVHYMQHGDR